MFVLTHSCLQRSREVECWDCCEGRLVTGCLDLGAFKKGSCIGIFLIEVFVISVVKPSGVQWRKKERKREREIEREKTKQHHLFISATPNIILHQSFFLNNVADFFSQQCISHATNCCNICLQRVHMQRNKIKMTIVYTHTHTHTGQESFGSLFCLGWSGIAVCK